MRVALKFDADTSYRLDRYTSATGRNAEAVINQVVEEWLETTGEAKLIVMRRNKGKNVIPFPTK